MTQAQTRRLYVGNRNQNPAQWIDFAWDDPLHGPQVKGEVVVIRPEGTSGNLSAGLWRTGHDIAGCERDGSCVVKYSAPLGDETMVLLEGAVNITETASGRQYEVAAGSILSHPKHIDLRWEISRPFLKKFWVMWDSPVPGTREDHLYVANIHDNPSTWQPFTWEQAGRGRQVCGEMHTIRATGSTGSYRCGLWRSGVGIAGCAADGSATFDYAAPFGDETMLLIEGHMRIVNQDTGDVHDLRGGDILALSEGHAIRWECRAPFAKLFRVITRAGAPDA